MNEIDVEYWVLTSYKFDFEGKFFMSYTRSYSFRYFELWGSWINSKKCTSCDKDISEYWLHGVCPDMESCGSWKHKLFFAALRGEVQEVMDPLKSDPSQNYSFIILLIVAEMMDFLMPQNFGLGTKHLIYQKSNRSYSIFQWGMEGFTLWLWSFKDELDIEKFLSCISNKVCIKNERVYHRRFSRVLNDCISKPDDIINLLKTRINNHGDMADT